MTMFQTFDPSSADRGSAKIHAIRRQILSRFLIYLSIVAPLALALSLSRIAEHGFNPIYIVHGLIALCTIIITLARKQIPYHLSAAYVLSICLIIGALGLNTFGMYDGGSLLLVFFALMAALLFGARSGIAACAISLGIVLISGILIVSGTVPIAIDINAYIRSPSAWAALMTNFVLFCPAIIFAYGTLHKNLTAAISDAQNSHAQHDRLINNLPHTIVYRYEPEAGLTYLSSSIHQILGYQPDEIITLPAHLFTPHPANKRAISTLKRSVRGVQTPQCELQLFHKNGSRRWLSISQTPVLNSSGKTTVIEGIAYDITDRKIQELAFKNILSAVASKANTDFFEAVVLRLTNTLDCDCALIGQFTETDEPALRTTALCMDGTPTENIIYPLKDSPAQPGATSEVIIVPSNAKDAFPDDPMLQQYNAQAYAAIPLKNTDGQPIGLLAALWTSPIQNDPVTQSVLQLFADYSEAEIEHRHDLQKQEKLEMQLKQSQKMEAVGLLAGGIAHDFNNMLGGIMGAAELLEPHLPENATTKQFHQMILDGVRRSADLTRQLLTFSRQNPAASSAVNVHDVIQSVTEILERTIDRRISIQTNLAAQSSDIIGDHSHLQTVFLNLGINASHAMLHGGTLHIDSSTVFLDETYCTESTFDLTPGNYLQIEMRDTGCGISKELLPRIFEPFFTTKETDQGTGLGLATALGTIQQHNGAIYVYSELGSGSSFHIYLPLSEPIGHSPDERAETATGHGTILLVDDEIAMRVTAEGILTHLGYDVTLANDGKEALETLKTNPVDLVILDMVMPEMNGTDCFYQIKRTHPHIKVIISSGLFHEKEVSEMKANGLNGFLRKPYSKADISQVVAAALNT